MATPSTTQRTLAATPSAYPSSAASTMTTSSHHHSHHHHAPAALQQLSEDKRLSSDEKRELVELRYRVLIETADSIAEMNRIVCESEKMYQTIQEDVNQIGSTHENTTLTLSSQQSSSIGPPTTQLQLLLLLRSYVLLPLHIWSALDAHDFERAISLYLATDNIATRLGMLEHILLDSQTQHPELAKMIEKLLPPGSASTALTTSASSSSSSTSSLSSILSSFYHTHSSYHIELPSLIGHTASSRLQMRALPVEMYSQALCAMAVVQKVDKKEMGRYLLQAFLDSKTKQAFDVLYAAETALRSCSTKRGNVSGALNILTHACTHVIYILQHTILDASLLFASVHSHINPHASHVSKTDDMVKSWSSVNVQENVARVMNKMKGAGNASTSTTPFALDSTLVHTSVSMWLTSIEQLLTASLSKLLPFLLQRKKKRSSSSSSSTSASQAFMTLRMEVMKATSWQDPHANNRREQPAVTEKTNKAIAEEMKEMKENKENLATSKRSASSSVQSHLTPAEQTLALRKSITSHWSDACTLLGFTSISSSASTSSSAGGISLFDRMFLSSFIAFTRTLVEAAFERVTLKEKVSEYLQEKKEDSTIATNESGVTSSSSSPTSTSTSASQLHGAREDEVHQLVHYFHSQLHQLGRECECLLRSEQAAVAASTPRSTAATPQPPSSFSSPSLQRYLHDDLHPSLTTKYNTLVSSIVDLLKKRLLSLEQSVLSSIADMTKWRSTEVLNMVEQCVFIGKVCMELKKQSNLMSFESVLNSVATEKKSTATTVSTTTTSATSNPVYSSLTTTSRSSFRVWSRYISAILSEDYTISLESWFELVRNMSGEQASVYWKQTMSNKNAVASAAPLGIALPHHPSSHITQLLFHLHQHYYRMFGYHIETEVLQGVIADLAMPLLKAYQRYLGKEGGAASAVSATDMLSSSSSINTESRHTNVIAKLSSFAVLQMMYDYQFLFAVLRLPPTAAPANATAASGPKAFQLELSSSTSSTDLRTRYTHLLSTFESTLAKQVDQIEWLSAKDAYNANLHAAFSRTGMMLGVLIKANPYPQLLPSLNANVSESAISSSSATTQIMPLMPIATKILTLPVSLYPSKHPQPVAAKPAASTASALSSSSATTPTSASHSHGHSSSSGGGLSFSNLSTDFTSRLALANTSAAVNAKAIGEIGSSLLGKLSNNSLWGSSAKK